MDEHDWIGDSDKKDSETDPESKADNPEDNKGGKQPEGEKEPDEIIIDIPEDSEDKQAIEKEDKEKAEIDKVELEQIETEVQKPEADKKKEVPEASKKKLPLESARVRRVFKEGEVLRNGTQIEMGSARFVFLTTLKVSVGNDEAETVTMSAVEEEEKAKSEVSTVVNLYGERFDTSKILAVLALVDIAPEVRELGKYPQFFHIKRPVTIIGTGKKAHVKVDDFKTVKPEHGAIVFAEGCFRIYPQEGVVGVR